MELLRRAIPGNLGDAVQLIAGSFCLGLGHVITHDSGGPFTAVVTVNGPAAGDAVFGVDLCGVQDGELIVSFHCVTFQFCVFGPELPWPHQPG